MLAMVCGDATEGGDSCGSGGCVGRKRKRVVKGSARAVERFAAFAAGVRVQDVTMVGGVHVLAGAKRTAVVVDERVVRQRGERDARRERREQAVRAAEEQRQRSSGSTRRRTDGGRSSTVNDRDGGGSGEEECEEAPESGGAGNWGAGGLGDRTGVG